MNDIVAFVPARGGSSRVPHKNLKCIGELPMFLRACYNLNQVLPKNKIVVDSDDEQILSLATEHGFKTIIRPEDLATNATDGNAFFRWETSNYPDADVYIQHLPPMVFLSKETLEESIHAVTEENYDSIVCVGEEKYYLWDADTMKPTYDLAHIPNSFNLKSTIFETMGLYVIKASVHKETGLRIGKNYKVIKANKFEEVDINYPDDFLFAEAIENGLPQESPYKSIQLLRGGYKELIEKYQYVETSFFACEGGVAA